MKANIAPHDTRFQRLLGWTVVFVGLKPHAVMRHAFGVNLQSYCKLRHTKNKKRFTSWLTTESAAPTARPISSLGFQPQECVAHKKEPSAVSAFHVFDATP